MRGTLLFYVTLKGNKATAKLWFAPHGHKIAPDDQTNQCTYSLYSGPANLKLTVSTCPFAGQFRTAPVMSALVTLLDDKDANMRAVAAIALGKTGKTYSACK